MNDHDRTDLTADIHSPGGTDMDQYVEKVIRMDEKIDRLIRDVREMKDDVQARVVVLEKDKADRGDLAKFEGLLKEAIAKMASSGDVNRLNDEIQKITKENKEATEKHEKEIVDLKEKYEKHENFKYWLSGIVVAINVIFGLAVFVWSHLK